MSSIRKIVTSFVDLAGTEWAVEILNTAYEDRPRAAQADLSDLIGFEPNTLYPDCVALDIEWPETEKHEALQGSAATLTLVSESDREFLDLYTVDPTAVRITVSRAGAVYWRGVMDPEQYEEPFERAGRYEVRLTFNDLGSLQRIKYSSDTPDEAESLSSLITRGLTAGGQTGIALAPNFTIRNADGTSIGLGLLGVLPSNFFDEDGEAMTWHDVLEGVLTPLSLRLVQNAGQWRLYDLPYQCILPTEAVDWQGDASTLGIDKVYNRFNVNFSPYAAKSASEAEVTAEDLAEPVEEYIYTNKYVYQTTLGDANYINMTAFKLRTSRALGDGRMTLPEGSGYRFYAIEPGSVGEEEGGILASFTTPNGGSVSGSGSNPAVICPLGHYTPPPEGTESGKGIIKLCVDLNIGGTDDLLAMFNQERGSQSRSSLNWADLVNFAYLPVRLYIVGDDGETRYFQNQRVIVQCGTYGDFRTDFYKPNVYGGYNHAADWQGSSAWGQMYLSFYNSPHPEDGTPVGIGWTTNRQSIGWNYFQRDGLPSWWDNRGEGEFIAAPPCAGNLYLEIGHRVLLTKMRPAPNNISDLPGGSAPLAFQGYTAKQTGTDSEGFPEYTYEGSYKEATSSINGQTGWLRLRNPRIEVCDWRGEVAEDSDITYTAALEPKAADELSIDTVCGTLTALTPANGRGYYFKSGAAMQTFSRDSRQGTAEELFIAAVASQYDTPHITLQGTAAAPVLPARVYTDPSFPGRKFVLVAIVHHCADAQAEVTLSELSEPKYYPVTTEQ